MDKTIKFAGVSAQEPVKISTATVPPGTGSSTGRASAGIDQNPHRHGPARDGIFDRGKIRAGHGQKTKIAEASAGTAQNPRGIFLMEWGVDC